MSISTITRQGTVVLLACASIGMLSGCGSKDKEASTAQQQAPAAAADASQAAAQPPAPLTASATTWTPEALEELLAPVALYPDVVLVQVLTAATNPQEVLDAGNWLIANPTLSGNALDEAAEVAGFTPPIRGLIQSPQVIDQMCLNMGWTEELGQAYVNDQAGVMDAAQRLRAQAQEVGTLQSSEQLKVETIPGPEPSAPPVITVSPPSPQVVYVPQYDPVAAYAPPPAPATTTTTTTTTESKGHSTGSLVATGVLAFGAGILVSEIFEDDDDDYWNNNYNNNWYRPYPPYPPYPYRPSYGNGFYPSNGYNRPNNYRGGNNNVVVVNQNNNYWNRYDGDRNIEANRRDAKSPISAAKPNRTELNKLNADAAKGPKRAAPSGDEAWKGKGGYAGADPAKRDSIEARTQAAKGKQGTPPKVQGSYAGAKPSAANRPADARPAASGTRPAAPSKAQNVDRGRVADASAKKPVAKPAAKPAAGPASNQSGAKPQRSGGGDRTAMSGSKAGASDRAASDRGRKSASKGVPKQSKGSGKSGGAQRRDR